MRLVGYNDLQARSAYQPVIHRQGSRYIAYVGHHGGVQVESADGREEQNGTSIIDVTDPAKPAVSRAHPGRQRRGRIGRRADGARVQRRASSRKATGARSTCCARSGTRRTRSGTSRSPKSRRASPSSSEACEARTRTGGNAIPGIAYLVSGREGLGLAPHDAGVRPLRSREARAHPQLRAVAGQEPGCEGQAAGLRAARSDLDRAQAQPHLLRLRHGARRPAADRRPREAPTGAKEPTPANLRRARRSRALDSAFHGRPHDAAGAGHGGAGVRKYTRARSTRDFVVDRERVDCRTSATSRARWSTSSTSPTSAAVSVSNFNVPEAAATSARAAAASARTRRTSTSIPPTTSASCSSRGSTPGVRAVDIRDPYCPKEIGYYIPAITREDRPALRQGRARPALQARDPDEQRRSRRPRLHLHRRSRGHRHAHPRADGARSCQPVARDKFRVVESQRDEPRYRDVTISLGSQWQASEAGDHVRSEEYNRACATRSAGVATSRCSSTKKSASVTHTGRFVVDRGLDGSARAVRAQGAAPRRSRRSFRPAITPTIEELRALKPRLVFNLTEWVGGDRRLDAAIAGVLEMMKLRYTGAGPRRHAARARQGARERASWPSSGSRVPRARDRQRPRRVARMLEFPARS